MKLENTYIEVWKDIKGYEGKYQVSDYGNVKNVIRNKLLKPVKTSSYFVITLYQYEKKQFYIHRLVAEAFIENPNILPEVNHKDENKENNNVNNLEWCTRKYNTNYGTRIERIANSKRGISKSIEAKEKISKKRIDDNLSKGENNPNCKKVICLTTGEIFNYIKQANEKYKLYKDSIRKCCKNESKYAGKLLDGTKLVWMYYDNYLKTTGKDK